MPAIRKPGAARVPKPKHEKAPSVAATEVVEPEHKQASATTEVIPAYPYHDVVYRYAAFTPAERESLKRSLQEHGQQVGIKTWCDPTGKIWTVEGYHRDTLCCELGIFPRYEDIGAIDEAEMIKLVAALNEHRRSRTTPRTNLEKQDDVLAELARDDNRSDRAIAELTHTSHPFVAKMREVFATLERPESEPVRGNVSTSEPVETAPEFVAEPTEPSPESATEPELEPESDDVAELVTEPEPELEPETVTTRSTRKDKRGRAGFGQRTQAGGKSRKSSRKSEPQVTPPLRAGSTEMPRTGGLGDDLPVVDVVQTDSGVIPVPREHAQHCAALDRIANGSDEQPDNPPVESLASAAAPVPSVSQDRFKAFNVALNELAAQYHDVVRVRQISTGHWQIRIIETVH